MPKIGASLKAEINQLSKQDLIKLVIKAATGSKTFYDHLIVNYIDKVNGEQDMFERAKQDLLLLTNKSYRGFSDELRMANMLDACNKRITEFAKVCKDKSLEMELILYALEIPFSMSTNYFTTCFTKYNYQVYLLVKKAITLLKTKLHEDYGIQYKPKLNEYLAILHRTSKHLDYIYAMPESI